MSTSLSNLVDNLSDGNHNDDKCANCRSSLEYISTRKNGKLLFECFDCERKYLIKFSKKLTKKFKNTDRSFNEDIVKKR